jgi:SAM-dependent methyltransferase
VENLELEVAAHDFTSLPVEHASLDAVVLWDVIEHLPNPRATISRAWDWLRPGGIIALSTGNVSSLAARIHGPDWSLLTPPWHQFYFSRKTLKRLLESCGFEVILTRGDGAVAVDRQSRRPRLRGRLASVLERPLITRGAARFGAGTIVFLFARKTPSRPSTERR